MVFLLRGMTSTTEIPITFRLYIAIYEEFMEAHAYLRSSQRDLLDFRLFWIGQIISSFGSSITRFALPLLLFKLTGSALDLAVSAALTILPYLCFGLIVGTWIDRVDRRRLMIVTDIGRGLMIAVLPVLYILGTLTVVWIYAIIFINATFAIAFDTASFAALPNLVQHDDLVVVNGRLSASYSAAEIVGPLLAGVLFAVVPLPLLLTGDAVSFLISAGSLALIRVGFTCCDKEHPSTSVGQALYSGLRYLLTHQVIRWTTLLALFLNLILTTVSAQFVLFAKETLTVTDSQLGLIYAVSGVSVVLASLAAGRLTKHTPFNVLGFGILMLEGLTIISLAISRQYWEGLLCWAMFSGTNTLWNIIARSLVQTMVPNALLGRVISFSRVLTWSVIPLSTLIGGALIERTQNVALIYGWIGGLMVVLACCFTLTPLGRIKNLCMEHQSIAQVSNRNKA
jgi:MFS family permease